jgi:hypothetical protein
MFNNFVFKSGGFYEIMYICKVRQTSREKYSMAHTLCVLFNYGYRQTFIICNTYCLSTATVVS